MGGESASNGQWFLQRFTDLVHDVRAMIRKTLIGHIDVVIDGKIRPWCIGNRIGGIGHVMRCRFVAFRSVEAELTVSLKI